REQTLDRAGRSVSDRPGRVDRDLANALAEVLGHRRRRRLLDQLLVPALNRAIALTQVNDVAVGVRKHLHLDVARILQIPLDVDGRVGEVRLTLALSRVEGAVALVVRVDDLQAFPASPRRGLDCQWPAVLFAEGAHFVGTRDRLGCSRGGLSSPGRRVGPGSIGTPAACMRSRAATFEPMTWIASGGGPIHTRPASSTARANAALSARNP